MSVVCVALLLVARGVGAQWTPAGGALAREPNGTLLVAAVLFPLAASAAALGVAWMRMPRPQQEMQLRVVPYDVVTEAEQVAMYASARRMFTAVADAAVDALRAEILACGGLPGPQVPRGAVLLDLRAVPPTRLSYLPRAALQAAIALTPAALARLHGEMDAYRPSEERLVVVCRAGLVRVYRLVVTTHDEVQGPPVLLLDSETQPVQHLLR